MCRDCPHGHGQIEVCITQQYTTTMIKNNKLCKACPHTGMHAWRLSTQAWTDGSILCMHSTAHSQNTLQLITV